jgi:hypothetical protein
LHRARTTGGRPRNRRAATERSREPRLLRKRLIRTARDRRECAAFSPTFFEEWFASIASGPDAEKGGCGIAIAPCEADRREASEQASGD